MEIGPIAGIPLITTLKPSSAVPDPSRVFAVEFSKPAGQDKPGRQDARSGLEEEESEHAPPSAEDESTPDEMVLDQDPEDNRPSRVNFFA